MKNVNISLPAPLFLIFLTLKLTNFIDWSWWWVFSPLWIPCIVIFGAVFVIALMGGKR